MAKASIHLAKAAKGGLKHNDRSEDREPDYLLPVEYRLQNEVDRSATEAEQLLKDLYAEAKENYAKERGQKLQAKSYVWEAVINLNKEHTLEDVQRLVKEIEKETGFRSVQVAVHRDEGRVERGTPIYNLHAHITFFTLDRQTGKQLMRRDITPSQRRELEQEIKDKYPDIGEKSLKAEVKKLKQERYKLFDRARLSKLQDLTAEALGMERGKQGSKAIRMEHKQYKEAKRQELAKIKDIQAENRRLREQLREAGADRAQYAQLEQTIRELKEQTKSKEITIEEMQDRIAQLEQELVKQDTIVEKIEELAAVAGVEPEEEPRATDQERFEAAKFLAFAIGKDWIKINKEWDGESQISTQEEIADYIQFTDENMDRAEVTASKLLSIWDVYCVSTRVKSNVDVKMLEQKGAFSRFYSIVKEKSRVDKAIELISSIMDKISGKSSTPSPVAQSSTTNHENRNMNRRGFRP